MGKYEYVAGLTGKRCKYLAHFPFSLTHGSYFLSNLEETTALPGIEPGYIVFPVKNNNVQFYLACCYRIKI